MFKRKTLADKLGEMLAETRMNEFTHRMHAEEKKVLMQHHADQASMYKARADWLQREIQKAEGGVKPVETKAEAMITRLRGGRRSEA